MTLRRYGFEAIGTRWKISAHCGSSEKEWQDLLEVIAGRIAEFDRAFSRFRQDSFVAEMNRQSGSYALPSDGRKLLEFYRKLYLATDGLVTPLIGRVMEDAGYGADYSFESRPMSVPPAWDDALVLNDGTLELKLPVLLDFGAAGKGYLVDIIGGILEDHGIKEFVIDAGGDILHRGSEAARVGLEDPADTTQVIGVARLSNASLCASAGSRRKWGDYHHIFNPRQLKPADRALATWVVADDAMTADGLATALFFTEPESLLQHFRFEYVVLHEDREVRCSKGFPAEIFTKEKR